MTSTQRLSVVAVSVPAAMSRLTSAAPTAQALVLGQSAVEIRVRTAPIFGSVAGNSATSKINFIGCTTAKGEGKASTAPQGHQVQLQDVAKATGGYTARGIPPRGTPV